MAILYPPIVDTYMPAFVDNCNIHFSIPSLNSAAEVSNIMVVSIVDQKTNKSILTNGILFCESDNNMLTINMNNIKLNINSYYKVQLKFIKFNSKAYQSASSILGNYKNVELPKGEENWLSSYNKECSEWSTVCLIRKISQPKIMLVNVPENDTGEPLIWTDNGNVFTGKLTFVDNNETELLKSFRITATAISLGKVVMDSGIQYTSGNRNPNEFQYISNYLFQDGETYLLTVECITQNDYKEIKTFYFTIKHDEETGTVLPNNTQIQVEIEKEAGRAKVTIIDNDNTPYKGNFVIRRTSSKSDFNYWEDIHFHPYKSDSSLKYCWYDYTIENGVIYKYCVQGIKKNKDILRRGPAFISTPCLVYFESTYLVADGLQLNIKYNTQVSSLSKIMQETKVETIGSKYPFIRKNGQIGYKEFSLSGLITLHMDESEDFFYAIKDSIKSESIEENSTGHTFSSEAITLGFSQTEEVREIEQAAFSTYREKNKITNYNDLIYEKKFRDKVLDFLQNNQIKLFKSATEGNLLVKLMNISLSPEQTLGRYIYNFSCTATEIDDFTLANCDKYNIQTIGEYQDIKFESEQITFFGQYKGTLSSSPLNKIVEMKYKYLNSDIAVQNDFKYFNYIQVQFESPPKYLTDNRGNTIFGYLLNINGNDIYVDANGFFEIGGKDVQITWLRCGIGQEVIINYNAVFETAESLKKKVIISQTFLANIGQITGEFKYEDSLQKYLRAKYYYNNEDCYQKLNAIHSLTIEADQGTVFYINDFNDNEANGYKYFNRHVIGPTGILTFYDENRDIQKEQQIINDFYFAGLHFTKLDATQIKRASIINGYVDYNEINENETDFYFLSTAAIKEPIPNVVYCIGDETNFQRHIYYNGKWYSINDNDDIAINVEAMINYIYVKEKGVYQKNENK